MSSAAATIAEEGSATAPERPRVALVPFQTGMTETFEPVGEVNIFALVREEERLAYEAHLGDLHPAHAQRLVEVAAELDHRWAQFA